MPAPGPSAPAARLRIEVEVWRGPIAESRHRVQAAVVNVAGTLGFATDHPGLVTSFRSSAKPFQLLPFVERGWAERWDFTDEHLAVMAASHTGSAYHVELVSGILKRLGVGESALACGYHDPLDSESLELVRAHPERRSPLYNNCSGKHAGMLAHAIAEGWPLEGYHRPEHPLQRRLLETVADLCGMEPQAVLVGIDGCNVSVFGVPVEAMARAFARFAAADSHGDARERALDRIRRAMMQYPRATGGRERFSTQLMEAAGGTLVAKGGAEGLECIGVPGRGLGIAVKCEDGRGRGMAPAVLALLDHLGVMDSERIAALEPQRQPMVKNAAGVVVGEIRARIEALDAVTS